MKHIIILLLSLSLVTVQAKTPEEVVAVDIPCYNTDTLFKELREMYKEYPIAMGITNDKANSTTSIWYSSLDKSWTIVATKDAISCIIGTGTNFEIVPYKKKNEV